MKPMELDILMGIKWLKSEYVDNNMIADDLYILITSSVYPQESP